MQKSLGSRRHAALLASLKHIRQGAGLRQADVAERLGQPQSFVSKYESGERRLDFLELESICEACGVDLDAFVTEYRKRL